jgi:hypothetical protein
MSGRHKNLPVAVHPGYRKYLMLGVVAVVAIVWTLVAVLA